MPASDGPPGTGCEGDPEDGEVDDCDRHVRQRACVQDGFARRDGAVELPALCRRRRQKDPAPAGAGDEKSGDQAVRIHPREVVRPDEDDDEASRAKRTAPPAITTAGRLEQLPYASRPKGGRQEHDAERQRDTMYIVDMLAPFISVRRRAGVAAVGDVGPCQPDAQRQKRQQRARLDELKNPLSEAVDSLPKRTTARTARFPSSVRRLRGYGVPSPRGRAVKRRMPRTRSSIPQRLSSPQRRHAAPKGPASAVGART